MFAPLVFAVTVGAIQLPPPRLPQPPRVPPAFKDQQAPKPRLRCGLTLVPADENIDARMRRELPDRQTTFTLRRVQPTMCRP